MAKKEYIERDAALQFVFDACAECMDACEEFDGIYADCNQCMLEGVKLKLRDLTAADVVERKIGKWIIDRKFGNDIMSGEQMVICSECHKGVLYGKTNFCPNCGAKMEETNDH